MKILYTKLRIILSLKRFELFSYVWKVNDNINSKLSSKKIDNTRPIELIIYQWFKIIANNLTTSN